MSRSLPKSAEESRITACLVWLNVGPTMAKVTGKWEYNQYRHDRHVCVDEGLDGSVLFPSAIIILLFLLLLGIGKILIYAVIIWKNNVFSCFVLLMLLAINNFVVIQLQIWVICSTLSHCILVNSLWKSRWNGMKRNSPKRETENQFFWNGKSLAPPDGL